MKLFILSLIFALTACSTTHKATNNISSTTLPTPTIAPQELSISPIEGVAQKLRSPEIIGVYHVTDKDNKLAAQLYIKWVYGFLHVTLNNNNLNKDTPSPADVHCLLPANEQLLSPKDTTKSNYTSIGYWQEPYIELIKCYAL